MTEIFRKELECGCVRSIVRRDAPAIDKSVVDAQGNVVGAPKMDGAGNFVMEEVEEEQDTYCHKHTGGLIEGQKAMQAVLARGGDYDEAMKALHSGATSPLLQLEAGDYGDVVQAFAGQVGAPGELVHVVSRVPVDYRPERWTIKPPEAEKWLSLVGAFLNDDGRFPALTAKNARPLADFKPAALNVWYLAKMPVSLYFLVGEDAPKGVDFVFELRGVPAAPRPPADSDLIGRELTAEEAAAFDEAAAEVHKDVVLTFKGRTPPRGGADLRFDLWQHAPEHFQPREIVVLSPPGGASWFKLVGAFVGADNLLPTAPLKEYAIPLDEPAPLEEELRSWPVVPPALPVTLLLLTTTAAQADTEVVVELRGKPAAKADA